MALEGFILDASPLILLSKIGALDLLGRLAPRVVVPSAVLAEAQAGPRRDWELPSLEQRDWLRIEPDRSLPAEILGWDLGAGESQTLGLALTLPEWEVVLDDLDARRCARSLGIPTTGTLGIVLRAKKAGLVPNAYPLVQALILKGAYLSPELVDTALRKVGEGSD